MAHKVDAAVKRALAVFEEWDTNKDGIITEDELKSVFVTLGMAEAAIQDVIVAANMTDNGGVSYKDLLSWLFTDNAPKVARAAAGVEKTDRADQLIDAIFRCASFQGPCISAEEWKRLHAAFASKVAPDTSLESISFGCFSKFHDNKVAVEEWRAYMDEVWNILGPNKFAVICEAVFREELERAERLAYLRAQCFQLSQGDLEEDVHPCMKEGVSCWPCGEAGLAFRAPDLPEEYTVVLWFMLSHTGDNREINSLLCSGNSEDLKDLLLVDTTGRLVTEEGNEGVIIDIGVWNLCVLTGCTNTSNESAAGYVCASFGRVETLPDVQPLDQSALSMLGICSSGSSFHVASLRIWSRALDHKEVVRLYQDEGALYGLDTEVELERRIREVESGKARDVADFRCLGVTGTNLQRVLGAVSANSSIQELQLQGNDIMGPAVLNDIVPFLALSGRYFGNGIWARHHSLKAIDLSGQKNIGWDVEESLLEAFPYSRCISLETRGTSLSLPAQIRLRNRPDKPTEVLQPVEISPNGTFLVLGECVTLRTRTYGCEIRYTLDGSPATANGELYVGPFPIEKPGDLQVRAVALWRGTDGKPGNMSAETVSDIQVVTPLCTIPDEVVESSLVLLGATPEEKVVLDQEAQETLASGISKSLGLAADGTSTVKIHTDAQGEGYLCVIELVRGAKLTGSDVAATLAKPSFASMAADACKELGSPVTLQGIKAPKLRALQHVTLDLEWGYGDGGADYLDASCIAYRGNILAEIVDFCGPKRLGRAPVFGNGTPTHSPLAPEAGDEEPAGRFDGTHGGVTHSGDIMDAERKKGKHVMNVLFPTLPQHITELYFVLSAYNSHDLSTFKTPFLRLFDAEQPWYELTRYTVASAGNKEAVLMCCLARRGGKWQVLALGTTCQGTIRNYRPILAAIRPVQSGHARWNVRGPLLLLRRLWDYNRLEVRKDVEATDDFQRMMRLFICSARESTFRYVLSYLADEVEDDMFGGYEGEDGEEA